MFGIVGLGELVTPYSAELPVMLAKASAIWNPIVYALKHPRYRAALADYLPRRVADCLHLTAESGSKSSSTRKTFETTQRAAPTAAAAAATGGGMCQQEQAVDIEIRQRQVLAVAAAAAEDNGGGRRQTVDIL